MNDLKSKALWAVNEAKKLNIDEAEIYCYKECRKDVFISNERIDGLEGHIDGVAVRVVVDKTLGFASTSSLAEEKIIKAIMDARSSARGIPRDPDWKFFPSDSLERTLDDVYDKDIDRIEFSTLTKLAGKMSKGSREFDARISSIEGTIEAKVFEQVIANTSGIAKSDMGTMLLGFVYVKAKESQKASTISDSIASRGLNIDLEEIGRKIAHEAVNNLDLKKAERMVIPVIFNPRVFSRVLASTFTPTVLATNVQLGRSFYADKLNQEIASEKLTILDDGTFPRGILSFSFDGEGVHSQRKAVVDRGILKTFLFDSYTAFKENRESTGNSSRFAQGRFPFSLPPINAPSNIVVSPGTKTREELSNSFDRVLILDDSANIFGDPVSGNISIVTRNAQIIEGGGAYHIKRSLVTGNVFSCLKQIVGVGTDVEVYPNVVTPSIVLEGLTVS
jgi:PmbA protein